MDSVFVAISIAPPLPMLYGIVVNQRGERFLNEDAYTGFLGTAITEQPGHKAWLILNRSMAWRMLLGLWPTGDQQWKNFVLPQAINLFRGGARRAESVAGLAKKLGLPAAGLQKTITDYDALARSGEPDSLGKGAKYMKPLGKGPFTAHGERFWRHGSCVPGALLASWQRGLCEFCSRLQRIGDSGGGGA